jgi:multidrug efflux pump subunit AcrA (membrane-fusion protein)
MTRYGVSESGRLPPVEETPDVRRAAAELAQAKQNSDRASELHKRKLISQQALEDAQTDLRLKTASYDAALQNARKSANGHRRVGCDDEAGRSIAARCIHPRAVRRVRPEAHGVGG